MIPSNIDEQKIYFAKDKSRFDNRQISRAFRGAQSDRHAEFRSSAETRQAILGLRFFGLVEASLPL